MIIQKYLSGKDKNILFSMEYECIIPADGQFGMYNYYNGDNDNDDIEYEENPEFSVDESGLRRYFQTALQERLKLGNSVSVVSDGSLNGDNYNDVGAEVKFSMIPHSTSNLDKLTQDLNFLKDNTYTNDSTGLHVHISSTNLASLNLYKVLAFLTNYDENSLFKLWPDRKGNEYAEDITSMFTSLESALRYLIITLRENLIHLPKNEAETYNDDIYTDEWVAFWDSVHESFTSLAGLQESISNMSRYFAINLRSLSKHGTVEFRHAGGYNYGEDVPKIVRHIKECVRTYDLLLSPPPLRIGKTYYTEKAFMDLINSFITSKEYIHKLFDKFNTSVGKGRYGMPIPHKDDLTSSRPLTDSPEKVLSKLDGTLESLLSLM